VAQVEVLHTPTPTQVRELLVKDFEAGLGALLQTIAILLEVAVVQGLLEGTLFKQLEEETAV